MPAKGEKIVLNRHCRKCKSKTSFCEFALHALNCWDQSPSTRLDIQVERIVIVQLDVVCSADVECLRQAEEAKILRANLSQSLLEAIL